MVPGALSAFQPDIWQCRRLKVGGPEWPWWNWKGLKYPYWRIYWNAEPGARVSFKGTDYRLDPDCAVVVAPNAAVDHHLDVRVTHHYLHLTLGYPYDSVTPRVDRVPTRDLPMRLLNIAVAGTDGLRPPKRLSFPQTLSAHAFAFSVLCALPKEIWPKPAASPVLLELVQDISQHPEQVYRTTTMAERCGMSVNTLLRRFRDQIGRSPQQLIAQSRLQKACILLDQTDQSIDQIAEACGFCDRYHFSKVFKVHFNCGPAAYRRKHLRSEQD